MGKSRWCSSLHVTMDMEQGNIMTSWRKLENNGKSGEIFIFT